MMPVAHLRRELVWAIALKLALLFSIKFAFFPHRLAADEAAQGVADRIASQVAPMSETVSKDKP
jgi:hypothetical protein